MYHFNGTAWVRLTPTTTSSVATNFHGINSTIVAHCSMSSPVSSTSKGFEGQDDKDQLHEQLQLSKNSRRAPLRQLFPRTPTPFKKAYAAAVRKGGQVEQIDLEKSPELFEDLQEIIFKDVILPPPKRSRRTVREQFSEASSSCRVKVEPCSTPAPSSSSNNFQYRYGAPSDDKILDTTSTPSKVLNDSSFLLSPPFRTDYAGETTSAKMEPSTPPTFIDFVEPELPPQPFSTAWYRIACGRTPAQVELTSMAREFLRNSDSRRSSN